jgi:hypothetical protein
MAAQSVIKLDGYVTYHPSGQPAEGVTVTMKKTVYDVTPNIITSESTSTDSDGHFEFEAEGRCAVVYAFTATSGEIVDNEPLPPSGEYSHSGCVLTDHTVNMLFARPVPIQIDGYVKYSNGEGVPGVTITMKRSKYDFNPPQVTTTTTTTGGSGYYQFTSWSRCSIAYEVTAAKTGSTFSPLGWSSSGCILQNHTHYDIISNTPPPPTPTPTPTPCPGCNCPAIPVVP